jgi:hypothetical protein
MEDLLEFLPEKMGHRYGLFLMTSVEAEGRQA